MIVIIKHTFGFSNGFLNCKKMLLNFCQISDQQFKIKRNDIFIITIKFKFIRNENKVGTFQLANITDVTSNAYSIHLKHLLKLNISLYENHSCRKCRKKIKYP